LLKIVVQAVLLVGDEAAVQSPNSYTVTFILVGV
jgi:hypothetical protein